MRLLRPPPRKRSTSAGATSNAFATSVARERPGSCAFKHDLLNLLPARADCIWRAANRLILRKQDARDIRWEIRVFQHFLQIIDEMGAANARNTSELLGATPFEEDVLGRDAVAAFRKEAVLPHPFARALAQVDAIWIVVSILGLVAHYHHRKPFGASTA